MRRSILAALFLAAFAVAPASAQSRCVVDDPTGTPLNVRDGINGNIIGSLPNGKLVRVKTGDTDSQGRPWVIISDYRSGQFIGWVFRRYIKCN